MEERRSYLGAVADLLVLINGSVGTIDEALKGLFLGKQVICLQNSGGASDVLSRFKKGEIDEETHNAKSEELYRAIGEIDESYNRLKQAYNSHLRIRTTN